MENLLVEANGKTILWKRLGIADAVQVKILLEEFCYEEPINSTFTSGISELKDFAEKVCMVSLAIN